MKVGTTTTAATSHGFPTKEVLGAKEPHPSFVGPKRALVD